MLLMVHEAALNAPWSQMRTATARWVCAVQCVIYDKNASDAKLIGIEYIIPKEKYDTLDAEEQRYWHRFQPCFLEHCC